MGGLSLFSAWTIVSLVVFCILATTSLLAMEGYVIGRRETAHAALARLRTWLDRNRDLAITVLNAVVGAHLVIQSALGLIG